MQVGVATDWQTVAAGLYYTVALRSDGTLWSWGDNRWGQLGDGSIMDRSSPVLVGTETDWQTVAAGLYYSVALRSDGTLWNWGLNIVGQLGDGTLSKRVSPTQVGTAANWKAVTTGYHHTVALCSDGTLWARGLNSYGQVGDGTFVGSRPSWGQVGTAVNWKGVSAGYRHTVALRNDNTLWTWGDNEYGQLGDGTITNTSAPVQVGTAANWQTMAAGEAHTTALKSNGTLWAWGWNIVGQLGDGTTTSSSDPVQVGAESDWQAVAAGQAHTIAVKTDGTLWTWGGNTDGQLGDGTKLRKSSPVQVGTATNWQVMAAGEDHTVAVKNDGTLWAWGRNSYGQLGDGTGVSKSSPLQVDMATNWQAVAAGPDHTVALKSDGSLWAWGLNDAGQLGDATNLVLVSPMRVGTATNWVAAAAGDNHTVALQSDGTLWAWGGNLYGQVTDWQTTPGKIGQPVIVVDPQDQAFPAGTRMSFAVGVTGSKPLSYQWQFNGTNLTNAEHIFGSKYASLTLFDLTQSDAGSYRVIVDNAYGSVTSSVAMLTVTIPAMSDSLELQPLSSGQMRLLVSGQAGRMLTLQGSPDLYHWAGLGGYSNASGTLVITSTPPEGRAAYFYRTFFWDRTITPVLAPNLSDLVPLADGRMRFLLHATPGSTWRVEGSPDLLHWGNYGVVTNLGSSLQITNKPHGNPKAYFYRAVQP